MKPVITLLMHLYPKTWRARYGEEFEALIEDSPPRWSTIFDLLKGALQMQLSMPNFPRLAVILSGVGMLVGFGISFLVTPRYTSMAEMALSVSPRTSPSAQRPDPALHFSQMQDEVLSRTSLSGIIQNPTLDLYKASRVHTPLEDVIAAMQRDIDIRPVDRPGSSRAGWLPFRITFTYADPHKSQHAVQAFLMKFQDMNLERHVSGINLEVVDPPSLPERATYPSRIVFTATGFGAGLTLAILMVVFRRRVPPPVPFPA
jgi:hypothetical protein